MSTAAALTVTTANICGLPLRPLPAVRERIADACARRGVVFGQELALSNPGYRQAFYDQAGAAGLVPVGSSECLVAVPKALTDRQVHTVRVHGGMPKVSPARYLTIVTGTYRGFPLALINCHTVSKPRRGVRASWWRITRHRQYLRELAAYVTALHEQGRTAIYGGDINMTARKLAGWTAYPTQQVLAQAGLDHLWIVPAEGITVTNLHRHPLIRPTRYMDHPIVSATFTLNRSTAPDE